MLKTSTIVSLLVIFAFLAGCGSQPNSSYPMPQQINEPIISEVTPEFEQQKERVNNCDGANPSYIVTYKTVETQNATFEVIIEAGGLVTGTPIPTALEVQLEAKIAAALSKQYGITVERNHEIFLENQPGTNIEHTITWKVTKVKGLLEVVYGDGVAQVAFNKIANVELYDRQPLSLSCDSNSTLPILDTPIAQQSTTTLEFVTTPILEPTVIGTTPPPNNANTIQPILDHYTVEVGDGIFNNATFSDGTAQYSEQWLYDNSHFDIQRIRPQEQPNGCDISRYNTNLVWISGTKGMSITVNGKSVGTYSAAADPHGYITKLQVGMGDKICAVGFTNVGYSIIMGPDIYYHYDSYCYRGNCNR